VTVSRSTSRFFQPQGLSTRTGIIGIFSFG